MRKIFKSAVVAAMALSLVACGGASTEDAKTEETKTEATEATEAAETEEVAKDSGSKDNEPSDTNLKHVDGAGKKIAMITDTGGVNDQSFNQSAWEGLQELSEETGVEVNYIESLQMSDFVTNFENLIDDGNELCWGIGFACSDAVKEAAEDNDEINFAIADFSYGDDVPENVTGVMFRSEDSSFLVGYIAAQVTESGKIGFVGGIESPIIDQFEYGFKAGVAYANKEFGTNAEVIAQYAESFSDAAKGKAIANKMFTDGCDIVFHAAGGTGNGVIEAAKEADKWAIGVDRDQAYLAPENVLTSALKNVNVAVVKVSKEFLAGHKIGGQNLMFGLKDGAVGIPANHENYDDAIYEKTMKIADFIKKGEITAPATPEAYEEYVESLK